MLDALKTAVCDANRQLPSTGLVALTWGNVSGIDRDKGIFGIKPSGVDYHELKPEHIVLVDLDGAVVEGDIFPSRKTNPLPRHHSRGSFLRDHPDLPRPHPRGSE